jgi:hypothetical protein
VVREHQCGLVCLPNANSIARGIVELLGDSAGARVMGKRAGNAALPQYSWCRLQPGMMSAAYDTIVKTYRATA